jgi:LmbE family N-acetylglucosaminyl deacetylase
VTAAVAVARAGVLVLSPHADDAALSLGGCLLLGRFGAPVTLATVFGRSNHVLGRFERDWEAVTRRRRGEDEAFAAALALGLRYLDLPEVALRPEACFGVFARRAGEALGAPDALAPALRALLDEIAPRLVLAPLGLGRHRDHLLLQRAARELLAGSPAALAYYEDMPYAEQLSGRAIARHARAVDARLKPCPLSIAPALERKVEALGCYPSQLGAADAAAVERHRRRRWRWWRAARGLPAVAAAEPFERLWTSAPHALRPAP